MLNEIKNIVENIVILTMVITILEMILPNTKNKKFVMFFGNLVLLINILNPIMRILKTDIKFTENIELWNNSMIKIENDFNYEIDFNKKYISNLKEDITKRLNSIGYKVLGMDIKLKENLEPDNIELKISYDNEIRPIVIDVFNERKEINEVEKNKIYYILMENYKLKKENININIY